jgi:diaminopimelate dehydrogenase
LHKIKIGIAGYGNIGRGAEAALTKTTDMQLTAVFTRRNPNELKINTPNVPVYSLDHAKNMQGEIDVMLLCSGSAKDLPEQAPHFASMYNIVDTYDRHANIPAYLEEVNRAATGTTAVCSVGWDPGLFSMLKLLGGAFLPDGTDYTFWGKGVSQGHSEAIRRLDGVKAVGRLGGLKGAVQYTIPIETAMEMVRSGANPGLTVREKHLRECFVVPEDDADLVKLETDIKTMPDYYAPYETIVHFITEDELLAKHMKMPHGGFVFRSGTTGENKQIMEFGLKLGSNPEFTASVMVAFARAAVRMSREGNFGAKTAFDIPLSYLSPKSRDELIKELL